MDENKELVPLNNSLSVPQTTPIDLQEYGIALYENTLAALISGIDYSIETDPPSLAEQETPVLYALPSILEDRARALTIMNELILSAEAFNKLITQDLNGTICPYTRTLEEYLGKDYKIPSLFDIVLPSTFSLPAIKTKITEFQTEIQNKMQDHLNVMVKEAANTSFPGITSENLGNAFAIYENGQYVIDKQKLTKHLEFDEIIRNIPQKVIDEQPYLTAIAILHRYSEIV